MVVLRGNTISVFLHFRRDDGPEHDCHPFVGGQDGALRVPLIRQFRFSYLVWFATLNGAPPKEKKLSSVLIIPH